jgi:hypothetical protein|nr:hypothetical protein [uncultured Rhodopila sp.]
MAREAAAGDCGGADAEAVTSLAALGLISDALSASNKVSCSNIDKEQRMMMERARSLGRIAVAQRLSGSGDWHAAMDTAIGLAREARTATTYQFGLVASHDTSFEDVTCDLARDLVVIGETRSGEELAERVQDAPTYFLAGCLGRLAGVLDRLGKTEESNEFRHQALGHVATMKNRSEQQIALGGIALGSFEARHLAEALELLRGSGLAEFQPDTFAVGIRLGFYRSMAMEEAVVGHYEEAWKIGEAVRNDTGFAPWVDLAEVLRAFAAAGLPAASRKVLGQAQALVTEVPADKVDPIFRAALGSTLIDAGEQEKGQNQLTAVEQAAEIVTSANLRAYYLESLIRAYAETGNTGQALDLLNRSFPDTTTLPGKISRWGALRDIALGAVRRGEATISVQVAEQAHDSELRDLIIRALAIRAANGGKYAEAEQWARMADSGRGIQVLLADVSARGALAVSGSARWIVVLRDEEGLHTFPGTFSSAFDP